MVLSAFFFAWMGATVKLSGPLPIAQKVFFRNIVTGLVAFIIAKRQNVSLLGARSSQLWLGLRSLTGVAAVFLYFYSVDRLVLADSAMLNKTFPFFVILAAGLFLKERITGRQVWGIVFAFAGALLIIKPRFDISVLPAVAGFASAILAGAAYAMVSYLRKMEAPATIVFYFAVANLVVSFPIMLTGFVWPNTTTLFYLLATGFCGAIAQYALTLAYKLAPASEVSVYNYLNVVFSAGIGFIIWHEVPDLLSLSGSLIIMATAVLLFISQKRNSPNKNWS